MSKSDLLDEMFFCFNESLYDKFHIAFSEAEITGSQNWELQRLLKPYNNRIEKAVKEVYAEMEEFLQEQHIHRIDDYSEDCELCLREARESQHERYMDEYDYRISV